MAKQKRKKSKAEHNLDKNFEEYYGERFGD